MLSSEELGWLKEIQDKIRASDMPEADKQWVTEMQWADAELGEIHCEEDYQRFKRLQASIEAEAENNGVPVNQMGKCDSQTMTGIMEWTRTPAGTMWMAIGGALLGWEERNA